MSDGEKTVNGHPVLVPSEPAPTPAGPVEPEPELPPIVNAAAQLYRGVVELHAFALKQHQGNLALVEDLVLIAAELGVPPNQLSTAASVARARELVAKERELEALKAAEKLS